VSRLRGSIKRRIRKHKNKKFLVVFDQERDSQVLTGFVEISEKTSQSKNLPYNYVYFRGLIFLQNKFESTERTKDEVIFSHLC